MGPAGWYLLLEMIAVFGVVVLLHGLRWRFGVVSSYAALTFMSFGAWAAPHHSAIEVGPLDFYVESSVFFTAALVNVFVLYVADGPRAGRMAMAIVVGTGILYTALALLLHAQFESTTPLPPSIFPSANPRAAFASIVASAIDITLLGVIWELAQKPALRLPLVLRVFFTLGAVLVVDAFVYVPLAWGGDLDFGSILVGNSLSRAVLALVYSPALALYLTYEMRHRGLRLTPRKLLAILSKEDLERELMSAKHSLRQGAEALWESEERYRRMVDDTPTMVFRFSAEGEVTYANRAMAKYYGLPVEELVGKWVLLPVHKWERREVWAKVLALSPSHPTVELTTRAFPQPETERLQRWVIQGIFAANGEGVAYQAVGEDITAQRAAALQLQRLGTAVAQVSDAIVVVDGAGQIEFVNAAFEKLLGVVGADIQGMSLWQILEKRIGPDDFATIDAAVQTGIALRVVVPMEVADGCSKSLATSLEPITEAGAKAPNGFVIIARDVSRELAVEGQLKRAQRMEAVGHLAAGVAHDFNNLLSVNWACVELLTQDLSLLPPPIDEQARQAIVDIRHATDKAALMTEQLMTLGQHQVTDSHGQATRLSDAVERLLPLLRRLLPATITLNTELADDPLVIWLDPMQLERAVMNLVVNARDAIEGSGSITITTHPDPLSEERLDTYPAARAGDYAALSVADTGQGIEATTQDRIFEPFFTTKSNQRGTGLGLAAVYSIVRQAGGHVAVASQLNAGSKFTLRFPTLQASPKSNKPSSRPSNGTVLYCESEASVRTQVTRLLRASGYQVVTANTPAEALARAKSAEEAPDVLLTDMVTDTTTGIELSRAARAEYPHIQAVVLSGSSSGPISAHAEQWLTVVNKPYKERQLLSAIASAVGEVRSR